MRRLDERQKRFADLYIIYGVAEKAAIEAGYSERYARGNAHKLVANSGIAEYIGERMKELASERIADATEVLEYLTKVMRREYMEHVVVTLNEERTTWVPDENGTVRKQTIKREIPKVVEIPARLSDSNKAGELLGKRYALFTDNVQVGDAPVIVDDIYGKDRAK